MELGIAWIVHNIALIGLDIALIELEIEQGTLSLRYIR